MAGRKIKGANILAVQVDGDVVIESNDGQCFVRRRLGIHMDGAAVADGSRALQTLSNVVLRDHGSLFLEIGVTATVIAVIVRVDDESHRFVCDALQRGLNLIGQGSVLVVDDHNTIIAHGPSNVPAAIPFKHVHFSRHSGYRYLNFAEILVLTGGEGAGE